MLKILVIIIFIIGVQTSDIYNQYKSIHSYKYKNYHPKLRRCHASIDYTRVPGSCTKFRRCSNGYLYIFRCPGNTVWNERFKVCSHSSNVNGRCRKNDEYDYKYFKYNQYSIYNQPTYSNKIYDEYSTKEMSMPNYPSYVPKHYKQYINEIRRLPDTILKLNL
ncbi:unnamed protein product [Brachionus calyciflorus]|uniref:Chitin-binding type-2 domain-containing protein n=1 Tax=Brachionus calyciflorus TaxID=104777 RepID=A0A814J859_9BILA|nr:unnamed protein product [Brachionus calyciflorus]